MERRIRRNRGKTNGRNAEDEKIGMTGHSNIEPERIKERNKSPGGGTRRRKHEC
jgi:hypothetical protein